MLTPEHQFDLLKTAVVVIPATIISLRVLRHQRRQTRPQLDVVICPIFVPAADGSSVLADEWPGILVRNQSSFPLRICNVGFRIGKNFFEFGRSLESDLTETPWPYEIAAHVRATFYFNERRDYGRRFRKAISPVLKGKFLWETVQGYAMTECAKTFSSPRLCRKTRRMLRQAADNRAKAFPLAQPNQIIEHVL
jgi:hypothetical protein